LQLDGALTVGVDDTGYDVKFFGDDSGEFMQWDTSEAKLKIVHTDESVGLEVYTNAAAQTTQPQLKVGRAATEYWGVFTADREAAVIHRQDESSGQMKTSFQQWDSNTSDTTGIWQWQYGDGSGGSLTQAMQLSQAGVLTVASLDIGGNVDIDGTTNLDAVDIDGAVQIDSTLTVGVDGTGYDVKFFGGAGRYMEWDESADSLILVDNVQLQLGTSADIRVLHDGTDSKIRSTTSDLYITQEANDKDIIFQSDDGSGGVETYFFLDGSASSGSPYTVFPDNSLLSFGTGNDMIISHNATNSLIQNNTGDLYIMNQANDKDLILQCDDGSGGNTAYLTLDGSAGYTTLQKNMVFADDVYARFGDAFDMEIGHDGSNSYISHTGVGDLIIQNSENDKDIIFKSDDGSGGLATYITIDGDNTLTEFSKGAQFASGSYVKLLDSIIAYFGTNNDLQIHHNGTDTFIENYTGDLKIIQKENDKDIIFQSDNGAGSTATYFFLDGSSATHDGSATTSLYTNWPDNSIISLGSSKDFSMYHNGTKTLFNNTTGNLEIRNSADDSDIIFQSDDGSGGVTAYLTLDGSAGYSVASKQIRFDDSVSALFGSSEDMGIYHNGTNTYIENATGNLEIINHLNDGDIILKSDDGSGGTTAYLTLDGSAANTIVHTDFLIPAQKKLRDSGNSNKYIELSDSSANVVYSAYAKHVWRTYDGSAYGDRMSITNTGELEAPRRKFAKTSNTDGDHDGDVVYFGGTTSMTTGALYHYKSDGTWELADADAASTCDGLLGVALGAASDTNGVLLRGMVTLDHDPGAVGDVLYVSTTAGDTTATAPSGSGDIVRVIGYCIDASNGQIWFNPDGTFVEVA